MIGISCNTIFEVGDVHGHIKIWIKRLVKKKGLKSKEICMSYLLVFETCDSEGLDGFVFGIQEVIKCH